MQLLQSSPAICKFLSGPALIHSFHISFPCGNCWRSQTLIESDFLKKKNLVMPQKIYKSAYPLNLYKIFWLHKPPEAYACAQLQSGTLSLEQKHARKHLFEETFINSRNRRNISSSYLKLQNFKDKNPESSCQYIFTDKKGELAEIN